MQLTVLSYMHDLEFFTVDTSQCLSESIVLVAKQHKFQSFGLDRDQV